MEAMAKSREAETHELLQLEAALRAAEGETGDAVRLLGEAEKALAAEPATGIRAAGLSAVRAYREELRRSLGGTAVESV